MDRLNAIQPQHRTENSYSSPGDPTLYPRIKGEGRVNANQAGPLKLFTVRGDGDCFWRAFAAAYYHTENLYPQVKARTRYWVDSHMPAAEREKLKKEQQRKKGTENAPINLDDDDDDNGGGDGGGGDGGGGDGGGGDDKGGGPVAGTPNAPIAIDDDSNQAPASKKRKTGNGRGGDGGRVY